MTDTKASIAQNSEHPVWNILNKNKYIEEFYPQAEAMYDSIKHIVNICGNITRDGDTIPAMKQFFDMWNEYSTETFRILGSLVNGEKEVSSNEHVTEKNTRSIPEVLY